MRGSIFPILSPPRSVKQRCAAGYRDGVRDRGGQTLQAQGVSRGSAAAPVEAPVELVGNWLASPHAQRGCLRGQDPPGASARCGERRRADHDHPPWSPGGPAGAANQRTAGLRGRHHRSPAAFQSGAVPWGAVRIDPPSTGTAWHDMLALARSHRVRACPSPRGTGPSRRRHGLRGWCCCPAEAVRSALRRRQRVNPWRSGDLYAGNHRP